MGRPAIFLDLDGTLVDSLADIGLAVNRCLEAAGHPTHPVATYQDFVGWGSLETVRRACPPGVDPHPIAAAFHDDYAARLIEHTRPYEGIPEVIAELTRQEVVLAVLSNKPDEMTKQIIAHFFPPGTFAEVAGARDDLPRKPDPTSVLAMAERLGVSPSASWFVGDTPVDIGTARSSGMHAVGVSWGFRSVAELTDAGAQTLCTHPSQLAQLLGA